MPVTHKILYSALALGLIFIGVYLILVPYIDLPSRYGASSMLMVRPTTYLVSAMPLSIGLAIILYLIDDKKYNILCKKLVLTGFSIGALGLIIVGPLVNHYF